MGQRKPPTQVGQVFGRLTVLSDTGKKCKEGKILYLCSCSCGNTKEASNKALRRGHCLSCGCITSEHMRKLGQKKTTHGHTRPSNGLVSKEYSCWMNMKSRCYSPNNLFFHNYGGRGITVCDRWRFSFENFLADMGPLPTPKHTIDKIDNDKGYGPDNCRWVTRKENNNNRRDNRRFDFPDGNMTISEAAEKYGVGRKNLQYRLTRANILPADAIVKKRLKSGPKMVDPMDLARPIGEYVSFDPFVDSDQDRNPLQCRVVKVVKTRDPQMCVALSGSHEIPAGTAARHERAWISETQSFGGFYYCIACCDREMTPGFWENKI